MKRRFSGVVIATVSLFWATNSHVEELKTQASCSPVIDRTQGNVTVTFSGGCTVGITPAQFKDIIGSVQAQRAIPPELLDRYEMISRAFGVTDTALTTFFASWVKSRSPSRTSTPSCARSRRAISTCSNKPKASPDDDPEVAAIKKEARRRDWRRRYGRAETLRQRIVDAAIAAVRRAQDVTDKRLLTAAKETADLGELKLAELQYAAAAESFAGRRSGTARREACSIGVSGQSRQGGAKRRQFSTRRHRPGGSVAYPRRQAERGRSPRCRHPQRSCHLIGGDKPAERGRTALQARTGHR